MGIGTTELIIILVIILIIFGVGKLPEVGAGLGRGLREFKKAQRDEKEIPAPPAPAEDDKKENKA